MHESMCQNSHESSAKLMDASISHPMTGHLTGSLPAKLVEERQLLGRNNSSCSISSSDFEFDFSEQVLYDEPPLSPKLASYNAFFPHWETVITSTNEAASNRTQDYTTAAASTNNIADAGLPQHMKESWETRNNATGADNNSDRTSNSVVINASDDDQLNSKKHGRVPLRSLMLERRDLDQLPPLFNNPHHPSNSCILKDGCAGDGDDDHHHHQKPTSMQSPLSCSSPSHYFSSSSASSSSSSTSSPELLDSQTKKKKNKCRRWSFNLDFLKKCSPGKAHADRLHQGQLQDLRVAENDHFNVDGLHLPLGRASISADESMRALNAADRTLTGYNFSRYESPRRHSTCGSSSSTSILINSSAAILKRDDEREAMNIKAREGKLQRRAISAPVSPAASPSRVPAAATRYPSAASPTSTRSRAIINMPSPHAQHYQQQRARAEETRRKTFLPYRPSLLGARFFLHFRPQPAQVC